MFGLSSYPILIDFVIRLREAEEAEARRLASRNKEELGIVFAGLVILLFLLLTYLPQRGWRCD